MWRAPTIAFALWPTPAACSCPLKSQIESSLEPDVRIHVNFSWGTWEGWGTSFAWWAQAWGGASIADQLADVFFTTNNATLTTSTGAFALPGLGFNIGRVVAGASSTIPVPSGEKMQGSPGIFQERQQPAFWLNWDSANPTSSSWDWSVDPERLAMMDKANQRGVDTWELFSKSPLWWMCSNHNPSGHSRGGSNLQSHSQREHAVYLASVAHHFRQNRGINVGTVEAFNEPSNSRWTADGDQEGCHFSVSEQDTVIEHLRNELDARDLQDVAVTASDENNYDVARAKWSELDDASRRVIEKVNVHGYQYDGGARDGLRLDVTGKRLWNSEYTDEDETGMGMARCLSMDFVYLRPTAWIYWQVLDTGRFGLISANASSGWIGTPSVKYYVLAQFTRHIRPGMRILHTRDVDTVAAYDPTDFKLVIVSINYNVPRFKNFYIDGAQASQKNVTRWCTNTRGVKRYTRFDDTQLKDSPAYFWSWFDEYTVQTFEVQLDDPALTTLPTTTTTRRSSSVSRSARCAAWPPTALIATVVSVAFLRVCGLAPRGL